MMKIIKFPDTILREKMPGFDFSNPVQDPIQLEKDLIDCMLAHNGMGLSANQVGIRTRVFVMGHTTHPEKAQAFFNPEIIKTVDEIEDLEEGCLSFPGIYVNIKRPKKIQARWQNSAGEWEEGVLQGYDCKCFLHELDHLEGIVFQDRVSEIKWALAVKKNKKNKRKVK
jgi:peptide deformylase